MRKGIVFIVLLLGCSNYDQTYSGSYKFDQVNCYVNNYEANCEELPIKNNLRDHIEIYRHFEKPYNGKTEIFVVSSMLEGLYGHSFITRCEKGKAIIDTKIISQYPTTCENGAAWAFLKLSVHIMYSMDKLMIGITLYEDFSTVRVFCPRFENGNAYTMILTYKRTTFKNEHLDYKDSDSDYYENSHSFYLPFSLVKVEDTLNPLGD